MQDCDASYTFQWQENNDATAWENLYAWPPDPMWTESNWPFGQPAFQLFQVSSLWLAQRNAASESNARIHVSSSSD